VEQLLYFHLGSKTISATPGGPAFVLPAIPQGDDVWIKSRFVEEINGASILRKKTVTKIKASIGAPDAAATAGTIQFEVGEVGSAEVATALAYNADATAVAAAFNALSNVGSGLTYGACTARVADGSWYLESVWTHCPVSVDLLISSLASGVQCRVPNRQQLLDHGAKPPE
jgi:hypothetical protein